MADLIKELRTIKRELRQAEAEIDVALVEELMERKYQVEMEILERVD
ncbi:hypothetical protein [Oceanobacillus salinisoli]|nr:hypothetical protein [Oceanobacillus salinisoli]